MLTRDRISFRPAVTARRLPTIAGGLGALVLFPGTAWADCTPPSPAVSVQCTGASTGYSNVSTGVNLTADSTAAITGPILLGNSAVVTNGGSATSSTTAPLIQVGSGTLITNNGTLSLTSSTTGSAALLLGDNGTVVNNGSLSAVAGTPVVQFGQNGTFTDNAAATAAVTGNIVFGPNVNGGTSTLNNNSTTYGITGNIYSSGSTAINNNGLLTGLLVQTPTGSNVSFNNGTAGVFTGGLSTGDTTTLVNNGAMSIASASSLGSARLGVSSLTNNGTLTIGTTSPTSLVVAGNFTNSASGVLNIALHSSGAVAPVAGTTYSQIYAAGSGGTAILGGTLNLVPTAGFYQSGSTYNVIVADQSISGNFASVNGTTLPFISFVPVGVVSLGTGQAYQVMAVRTATYAGAIGSAGTADQLVIANALQPLVTAANADPTSNAAGLVGTIDLLTVPQSLTLLNQFNPVGYLAYGQALADQMNIFNRQVRMRMLDFRADSEPAGFWIDANAQFHLGSTPTEGSREQLYGLTAGYDISGPHWVLGAAIGLSSATLRDATSGLSGHNNAFMFGGYGAVHAGPLVATAQLGYDLGNISATKALSLTYATTTVAATSTAAATTTTAASNTTVTASPKDHLLKFSGTLGVALPVAGIKVTPFVGLDYARGAINGFTEAGASAADLTVSRISLNRTDLLGGIEITPSDGKFRPYVRGDYRSELGGSASPVVTAVFNADPNTSFSLTDLTASRKQADVDAGVNIVWEEGGTIFLGYQGTLRSHMSEHGLHAGIRLSF
ncbi:MULTISPECIES: autotransporter outer membrane beta-barrel domain-containing protein [Sphingomonas]|uniref:autotransporter outer membrane beta-barrel domain-containing protein n=1 Tax=Sphingomonas TaxID=13687 RepID=UPI000DF00B11|nr:MULTISPECIES: autotransporter outer membrane beta-barrel domain-containing protein [Sphingomonas]